jgi:hypothetical protein
VARDKKNLVLSTKTVFTSGQTFSAPIVLGCEFNPAKEALLLFIRQVAERSHTFYTIGATILSRSCDATFVMKFNAIKRVFPVSNRQTIYGHSVITGEGKECGI